MNLRTILQKSIASNFYQNLMRLNPKRGLSLVLLAASLSLAGCMPHGGESMDEAQIEKMSAKFDEHMTEIKQKLNLNPEQAKLWARFDQVAHEQMAAMKSDMMAHMQMRKSESDGAAKPNLIDRLAKRQSMMETNANRLKTVIAALTPLYNSLSAEQKKMVEEEMEKFHPGGRHGKWHRKFW